MGRAVNLRGTSDDHRARIGGTGAEPSRLWLEQELEAAGFELEPEAEHDSRYRAARQEYLRQLLTDPQQPRYVQGWIRHQLHRLARVERAQQQGRRPPGGSARHLRGIPGMDVGHKLGKHY